MLHSAKEQAQHISLLRYSHAKCINMIFFFVIFYPALFLNTVSSQIAQKALYNITHLFGIAKDKAYSTIIIGNTMKSHTAPFAHKCNEKQN